MAELLHKTDQGFPQIAEGPAGVEHVSDWQHDEPTPRRYISVENHGVQGHDLTVWWDATQFADGSIEVDRDPPTVRVDGLIWERGLTGAQARELADLLIGGADEIDRWVAADCTRHERDV